MDDFEKLYNKALRFLSFRPRSEKETRDYIKIKNQRSKIKTNESIIISVIEKLKEKKFIDDFEFAKWWISSRSSFKPRSIKMIILELKQKGIAQEIIDNIIHNSEFIIQNDFEMAKKLIEKKINLYRGKPFDEIKIKLQRLLLSKGFSFETIKETIEEFKKNFSSVDKS